MTHEQEEELQCSGHSRRSFLKRTTATAAILAAPTALIKAAGNKLDERGALTLNKCHCSWK